MARFRCDEGVTMGFEEALGWARTQVETGMVPGGVLGVVTADGAVELDAVGDARPGDAYPLFSITKALVGVSVGRLLASGELSLDARLADAVPGFGADRPDEVLLRHLVSHSAGIPEPALDFAGDLDEALLSPGRDFVAGTASRYSSIGYQGIVRMVEHATGRAWEDVLASDLAAVGATGVTLDTAATEHRPVLRGDATLDWEAFASLRHPGAGAVGTAEDLLAVGRSLLADDGALVAPQTLALMRTSLVDDARLLDPYPPERGCAWGVTFCLRRDVAGLDARDGFGHAGWAGTEFWVHPECGVAFVWLTNVAGAEGEGMDPIALANAVLA